MFWTKKDKDAAHQDRMTIVQAFEQVAAQISFLASSTERVSNLLQSIASLLIEIRESQALILEKLDSEGPKDKSRAASKKSEKLN